jgi:hypothetical protein
MAETAGTASQKSQDEDRIVKTPGSSKERVGAWYDGVDGGEGSGCKGGKMNKVVLRSDRLVKLKRGLLPISIARRSRKKRRTHGKTQVGVEDDLAKALNGEDGVKRA